MLNIFNILLDHKLFKLPSHINMHGHALTVKRRKLIIIS